MVDYAVTLVIEPTKTACSANFRRQLHRFCPQGKNALRPLIPTALLPLFLLATVCGAIFVGVAVAQDIADPPDAASEPDAGSAPGALPLVPDEDPMELVEVDWFEEMVEGGVTMLFLGLLSVSLLAFAGERLIVLRAGRFVPPGLTSKVLPLFLKRDFDGVLAECRKQPSTLARVIAYMTEHRDADPQLLAFTAGDLGAREIVDQEQRTVPFAVIAALAPLLGLLGTMIGMIEAFKLVEVFGDEGGASMLAGSISKALITTAVGLILAIPAVACYHIFKHRVHAITQRLEAETEKLFSAWFVLPKDKQPAAKAGARRAAVAVTDDKPGHGTKNAPASKPTADAAPEAV